MYQGFSLFKSRDFTIRVLLHVFNLKIIGKLKVNQI